jgi:hypothetical protein
VTDLEQTYRRFLDKGRRHHEAIRATANYYGLPIRSVETALNLRKHPNEPSVIEKEPA